ncbi:CHAT domain-containing protein [Desulfococcaceae bacterium HSG7]|nr:CHAT domain-containing protein [Desulfococcaceae bacterium HSG7]
MRYYNFDISIDNKINGSYPLLVKSELFGEARSLLNLDPFCAEIQEKLKRLESRETDKDFLKRFGTDLFKYIFKDEIATIFQQSYGYVLGEADTGLRVRLRIQPPEIAILPWELLYFPSAKCFMGASDRCPLVRYIELSQRIQSIQTTLPMRMLVVIPANVDPYPEIDTQTEKANLIQILDNLQDRIQVTFLEGQVTYQRISDALMDRRYHCFHFIGHGDFQEDTGALLINTDNGDPDYVDENRFASLFQNHPTMKLVLLNACKGAKGSYVSPLAGMAPKLVMRGIPAVVAMQYTIYDAAAILFGREFYRKLFKGWNAGRVDIAMTHARNRLAADFPDDRDMGTPVLFMRAPKGVLFNPLSDNPIKNIPFAKQKRHTAETVSNTYEQNLDIEENTQDKTELNKHKQRIKFRNYALVAAFITIGSIFFLSWIYVFDILQLDTKVEGITIWLSDRFIGQFIGEKKFNDKHIALVIIKDKSFSDHRMNWRRKKYPKLLDKLSLAGARVIAFDMYFKDEFTEEDDTFLNAMQKAREKETDIIVGIKELDKKNNQPPNYDKLKDIVTGFGWLFIGKKDEVATTAPLAILREMVIIKNGKKSFSYFPALKSLALAAYEAYWDEKMDEADIDKKIIWLVSGRRSIRFSGRRSIRFSELLNFEQIKGHFRFIQENDKAASVFLNLSPIEVLEGSPPSWQYDAVINMTDSDLKKNFYGRVVFVGVAIESDRRNVYWEFLGIKRYGVQLHAEALNTLLNEVVIRSLGNTGQLYIMIFLGLLGAFIRFKAAPLPRFVRAILICAVLGGYFMSTILIYAWFHILLNTVYHLLAFWLTYWATDKIERKMF